MLTWKLPGLTITMAATGKRAKDGDEESDPALRALAAELHTALAPVTPRADYRRDLGRELAAVARQRRAPRIVMQRPHNYRRDLLIGAAAVSSAVSVAGLVAFIWRHRGRQTAHGTL